MIPNQYVMGFMASFVLDLQLFADAGTLVNATGRYQNAYDATSYQAFTSSSTLAPTMKTYYEQELLDNSRDKLIYGQLGKKYALPAHHGKVIEWRKWNTLPRLAELTEGVIPTGQKLGMTALNVELHQYGEYVAVTDQLDLFAYDDVIQGASEELGAASGETEEILIRDVLAANANILYADAYNGDTYNSTPATEAALQTALATYKCNVTPDMINKAATNLKVGKAPAFSGNMYVCVIHPHCTYDLRKHPDWRAPHEYCRPEEIFNGEIGELHGVRFVESNLAPIIKSAGQTYATYKTMVFGKDAFGIPDPEGASDGIIVKTKEQVGGPLNQFSTIGTKKYVAAKILYPERICTIWSGSSYSSVDTAN